MSERVHQFADSFRQRLTKIERMIDEAKLGLGEVESRDSSDLDPSLKSARYKFEAAKHEVQAAESRMTSWLKDKEASDVSVVQGWKDECESRKLEHQAASAEEDAEAGIYLAEAAIVNAVIATYEAIDARRAAEHAETVSPVG